MPNVFLSTLPSTEEGAKLVLSETEEYYCKVVYRIKDSTTAVFHGLWDPDTDYSDEYVIVPFKSTYIGLTSKIYPAGTRFANIINSSRDVSSTRDSWIRVLRKAYGDPDLSCCTDGNIYKSKNPADLSDTPYLGEVCCPEKRDGRWTYPKVIPFSCHGLTVGGHIIVNETNAAEYEGTEVLMLPICNRHNISELDSHRFGVGYYMLLRADMRAAVLSGYIHLPNE